MTGLEVAVIGMAGRFPGAGNIGEFWENLRNGAEGIEFFSVEDVIEGGIPVEMVNDKRYVRAGGVIDSIDCFDAGFFDYTPGEAEVIDPQVRLFHEYSVLALEDAGYAPWNFKGQIGIFAGAAGNIGWEALVMFSGGDFIARHMSDKDAICTQVSYKLNLRGPASLVQTACSTSLVAVHQACRSLLTGDCTMALAGGIRAVEPQRQGYFYREGLVYSPDGHCRAFDENGAGTVPGNGIGIVVLKLLKTALADRDHIYAVIKGSAVNNDGNRKVGYSAPSIEGQAEVIRMAYRMARVKPATVDFIEAHGTATELGDAVEIEALKLAFRGGEEKTCAVGTVKSNIGHLDAAAGVAGLIKAVLCIQHRTLVPTLHFRKLNRKIQLDGSRFYINDKLQEWTETSRPLRGGVSAFGIGGTNVHVILEEAPQLGEREVDEKLPRLLVWSAKTASALERITANLAGFFRERGDLSLIDAAFTLQVGRGHFKYRKSAVITGTDEAAEALLAESSPLVAADTVLGTKVELSFLFPGQGSQYPGMAYGLYNQQPVFRKHLDRCIEILRPLLGMDVKAVLFTGEGDNSGLPSEIEQSPVIQPLIFAVEYAMARLLMEWGLTPSALAGYSFGEFTAACLAGVFNLEDVLKIVVLRARLMAEMPRGAMLNVPMGEKELTDIIAVEPWRDRVFLAVVNEDACIVSGEVSDINAFEAELKRRRTICLRLSATLAGHSSMMTRGMETLKTAINNIVLSEPSIPLVSNITGKWLTVDEAKDPAYWCRLMTDTVRFSDAVRTILSKIPGTVLVEVGPGRDLSVLMRRMVDNAGARVVNTMRPPNRDEHDLSYLLRRIGRLWLSGVTVDWAALYTGEMPGRIPMPGYSFDRQRYWPEANPDFSAYLQGVGRPATARPGQEKPLDELEKKPVRLREKPLVESVYAAPGTALEERLVQVWEQFFGFGPIGIHDDFFDLGGDSLKATSVANLIHKTLLIRVPLETFFKCSTVRTLAAHLERKWTGGFTAIEPAEKKEYYRMSPAQKRLFILQQMEPGSIVYNLPQVVPLGNADVDPGQLERAFYRLIDYHESLRTSFHTVAGEPVQRIHDRVEFKIDMLPDPLQPRDLMAGFVRSFDLSHAPLIRVGYFKDDSGSAFLMVDIHHIITDGVSMATLPGDFAAILNGASLQPLRVQYKDFAEWQQSPEVKESLRRQEEYWSAQFSDGEIPVLNIPSDFPRPPVQSYEGRSLLFHLGDRFTNALRKFASTGNATLYMAFLAVFNIMLSRLSHQEDILLGTPTAGRNHADLQRVMGMFVNTLVMRNFPAANKSASGFLAEVKQRALEAFDNQDYPLEELVEKVDVNRDLSRNPVFDVLVAMQTQVENTGQTSKHRVSNQNEAPDSVELPYTVARFDLTFQGVETAAGIVLTVEYCIRLFRESTIRRFVDYLDRVVTSVADNPDIALGDVDILSPEEREKILYGFNAREKDYCNTKTLIGLFEDQVSKTPDLPVIYPETGTNVRTRFIASASDSRPPSISYRRLNVMSAVLAAHLTEKGINPGSIAAVISEPSVEMVAGILGILKAGAAYMPVDTSSPGERIRFLLNDSGAEFVLNASLPGGSDVYHALEENERRQVVSLYDFEWKSVKNGWEERFERCPYDDVDRIAYVIYTSGTTGRPKGVGLTHRNASPLMHWSYETWEIGPGERVLENLSYCFDWSVLEMFLALTTGACLYPVSTERRGDPGALLDYMEENQITVLHATPSHFGYLAGHEKAVTGMRFLNYLMFGGEKFTIDLLHRAFASTGPHCRVFNVFGPTEATITCAVMEATAWRTPPPHFPELTSVPAGPPIINTELYILDPGGNPCPVKVAGELFIAGDCVANGYLNRPELTAEVFLSPDGFCKPGSMKHRTPTSYLYKTGDKVRWLEDGTIEYLGRFDSQVKVRGFRVELGEIERRLVELDSVEDAVVIVRSDGGDKYLCGYAVLKAAVETEALKESLGHVLPHYMVPPVMVAIEKLPLTQNGKVNRRALPDPGFGGEEGFCGPTDDLERTLVRIWSEVLGLEEEKISIDEDFFHLGGNSLNATRLVSLVHKELEVKVPLTEVFQSRTVRGIARFIREQNENDESESVKWIEKGIEKETGKEIGKGKEASEKISGGYIGNRYVGVEAVEVREFYPLSSAQRRLFFIQQMAPGNIVYNIPMMLPVQPETDIKRLENTFKQLIDRHESLRTSFHMVNGKPVQKVHEQVNFGIETVIPGAGETPAAMAARLIRPFDLTEAPLFRVYVVMQTLEGKNIPAVLVLDIHHIISDGISMNVLQEDFSALDNGGTLPDLRLQYTDYVFWQQGTGQQQVMADQERFWVERFSDNVPVLELPYDFPRPMMQSFEGSRYAFMISRRQSSQLRHLADQTDTTPFMVFLAVYTILLSKLGNCEDVVVGTPVAARRHADLQRIIGMFVNTLALRNAPLGTHTFSDFLKEVKRNNLKALENQEYPFEELVERAAVKRDIGRSPLFDVMFSYQNQSPFGDIGDDDTAPESPLVFPVAKFDMTLTIYESGTRYLCHWEYCTKLFKPETVERFAKYLQQVLCQVVDQPGISLSDVQVMAEEEKEAVLSALNNVLCDFPQEKTIHRLFEEQVEKRPDGIALTEKVQMTYSQLDYRAGHLASVLIEKGVQPGRMVALIIGRCPEMIVSILAVLKAGAAYLPIDPEYPGERIQFMILDSGAGFVLDADEDKEGGVCSLLEEDSRLQCLNFHTFQWPVQVYRNRALNGSSFGRRPMVMGNNTAYVIYTSGTTGKPKGCMIEHRNVVRLLVNDRFQFELDKRDVWTLFHSYCFDFSVWEMYGALFYGGRLVMVPALTARDPKEFLRMLGRECVTVLNQTPAAFYQLAEAELERVGPPLGLKYVIFGGEALNPAQLKGFYEKYPCTKLINMFGITETTVHVTYKRIERHDIETGISNIGRPIPTLGVFILDKYLNPVPRGVSGEICVGGEGVGRGYLNRPELTADVFLSSLGSRRHGGTIPSALDIVNAFYRSGDMGRLTENGDIEYLGRMDAQVKIRGHRIETGEIEFQLKRHPGIRDVVVTAVEARGTGTRYLCAYIVRDMDTDAATSGRETGVRGVGEFLADKVPSYMVPSYVVELDKIPLTPNGKVDRDALPHPLAIDIHDEGDTYAAPQTELQRIIVEVWKEVLGREQVGIRDNFFDLGGTSLDLINVVKLLKDKTGRDIPVVDLFTFPTIESLTDHLSPRQEPSAAKAVQPPVAAEPSELIDEGKDFMTDFLDDFDE